MPLSDNEKNELRQLSTQLETASKRLGALQERESGRVRNGDHSLPICLRSVGEKMDEAVEELGELLDHFAHR